MIEAGVALHEAGQNKLLHICIRPADHICDRFMQVKGITGHQENEIGLMRLYHATGNAKYSDMALRFLDLRGQDPHWFEEHTPRHPGVHYGGYDISLRAPPTTNPMCPFGSRPLPKATRYASCTCSPL